ncbi:MAG: hypothetical protein ACOH12_13020 [Parvibaculaceae bacterium]
MSDLASIAVTASQSQTQISMSTAMMKAGQKQDQAVVDMLSAAVEQGKSQAAAPAGMGGVVDIRA